MSITTDTQAKADRKAKREARREKQRAENNVRAEKMHVARKNASIEPCEASAPPSFNVGCSGWFYWHWRECFYPQGSKSNAWFPHYAGQFTTVELNAPFYSWPTVATVKSWLRQSKNPDFIYTVKVCELITHTKKFIGTKRLVQDFGFIADLLGPQMGCFLFQLPPSYHYSAARLKTIVSQLDPARRNVVEFRHASWWKEHVYKAFRKAGIIFCSCSGPRLPDELIATADDIYIRFHGPQKWYRHNYTREELAIWVKRIKESGAKRVWAYFNNDRDCYAIANARELLEQLYNADATL